MNVERWTALRQVYWQKLEELLNQIDRRGLTSLSPEQLHSLGRLYRSAASDLARARAMKLGPEIGSYLNNLVIRGHNQVYRSKNNRWRDLWQFLWITFPSVYRNNIVYVLSALAIFAVAMLGTWAEVLKDPNFARLELKPSEPAVSEEIWNYVEKHRMWTESTASESPAAASFITVNNIKVSLLAYALGATGGIGTVLVLIINGISIGAIFAVCQLHGMAGRLFAFVAPHGVFELSAIFIAGGSGLMLAKGILFPGNYRRLDSIRMMAREGSILLLGTLPLLLIAGSIEGFISPREDLSPELKFAVSLSTFFLLSLYLFCPRSGTNESQQQEKLKNSPQQG